MIINQLLPEGHQAEFISLNWLDMRITVDLILAMVGYFGGAAGASPLERVAQDHPADFGREAEARGKHSPLKTPSNFFPRTKNRLLRFTSCPLLPASISRILL